MSIEPDDLPEAPELELGLDDMQLDTLSGDMRDALLTRVRQLDRPWSQLTEIEQADLANGIDLAARQIVRRAVHMLTDWEWPRCVVDLGEMKVVPGDKRRIEVKVVAQKEPENLAILGEAVGRTALLLMVDSETFLGERAPAEIDPDQPGLPMDTPPVADSTSLAGEPESEAA